ncbi:MAG: hypothetical protein ACKN9T_18130 [Candidatus Methylumidiphilus sp.]
MLACRHCQARWGWAVRHCPFCGAAADIAAPPATPTQRTPTEPPPRHAAPAWAPTGPTPTEPPRRVPPVWMPAAPTPTQRPPRPLRKRKLPRPQAARSLREALARQLYATAHLLVGVAIGAYLVFASAPPSKPACPPTTQNPAETNSTKHSPGAKPVTTHSEKP